MVNVFYKKFGKIPFFGEFLKFVYKKIKYHFHGLDDGASYDKIYNFGQYKSFFSDASSFKIKTNFNESQMVYGEIVKVIKNEKNIKKVFLPGENNKSKCVYKDLLGDIDIITGGLSNDVDVVWNFELDPPKGLHAFDLIVSQAMIEHIINPYKHIADLVQMLGEGGKLIIHTVIPGFPYHRYPIDCLRYYPDWFEEVADRLHVKICNKYINEYHIFYVFQK